MKKLDDSALAQVIAKRLGEELDGLDPSITARLDSARLNAMAAAKSDLQEESQFVRSIASKLKESEELPSAITVKLNTARTKAISQSQPSTLPSIFTQLYQSLFGEGFGLTSGMIATACLTLTVAALFYQSPDPSAVLAIDEQLGLIASSEELELYENLDFYMWLAENELLN